MRIFLSYARSDREVVDQLSADLRRLGHTVWIDSRLAGGQAWWDEILRQIRDADVVIAAVSPSWRASAASRREAEYALSLRKAVLPVSIRAADVESLPLELAELQLVPYLPADPAVVRSLAAAARRLRGSSGSELPDPLPTPPPIPPLDGTD
jgi:hypothetical protein